MKWHLKKQKTSTTTIAIQVKIASKKDYSKEFNICLRPFFNFFVVSSSNNSFSNCCTTSCALVIKSWPILESHRLFDATPVFDCFLTTYHFFSNNLNTFEIIIGSRFISCAILFCESPESLPLISAREIYCMIMYCACVRSNFFNTLLSDFCRCWVDNQRQYPVSFVGLDDIFVCGGWCKVI